MNYEEELSNIYGQLQYLKNSISKLGPKRRIGSNFETKVKESKTLYGLFKNIIQCLPKGVSKEIIFLCSCIEKCYEKILAFEQESKSCSTSSSSELRIMSSERFNFKTAVSLLPKMTSSEEVTQDLIDAIELYESSLDDGDKQMLIKFVLKTRLTSGAKMRLATSYNSVDLLLRDMRTHLLTHKSDTALQARLQKARQGERSIKDFGKEIEKLFIDLTISQANGDDNSYKIFRPANERNAVRCFADGLRNQRLSTIISARNVTSLKDAIRLAEDECCAAPEHGVMSYHNRRLPYRGNNKYFPNNSNYFYNNRKMSQPSQMSAAPRHVFRGGRGARGRGASSIRFIQLAEERSRPAFDSIQSVVNAVGSVAMMLENTFFALTSSFRAILGVAENFGRLRSLFAQFWSTFAVVRSLNWLVRKLLVLLGIRTENEFKAWAEAVAATQAGSATPEQKAKGSSWPILLFFGVIAAAPYIVLKMLNGLTNSIHERLQDPNTWQNPLRAVAQHDFQASSPQEISFKANQVLTLAPQHLQGHLWNSGWLMATVDRQFAGLVPVNYIKVIKPNPTSEPKQETSEDLEKIYTEEL